MAMNVPTWANAGVSPSAEKKAEGYSAGECLPAQHLNWFLNQIFSNLSESKSVLDKIMTGIGTPVKFIIGHYIGAGEDDLTIDLGVKPLAVIIERSPKYQPNDGLGVMFATRDVIFMQGNLTSSRKYLEIVDKGFWVSGYGNYSLTQAGYTFPYIAIIEME